MTTLTAKPFTARPLTARPFTAYPFGESTSVSNPLVWHAAYPDTDGVMQAQVRGEGTPSFTVDDGLLLPDHEGIYRTTAEDAAPWHGARKVVNLLPYSEDLTNGWTTVSGAAVVDATTASFDGTSNGNIAKTYTISNNDTSRVFVLSASVRLVSGTLSSATDVQLRIGGNAVNVATVNIGDSVSSTSKRFSTSTNLNGSFSDLNSVLICNVSATLEFTNIQLEEVTGQANQNPSEYVPTTTAAASTYLSYANGNTVVDNVVVPAKGATLDPLPSLYGGPSYTNSLTYSNDLTNAAWSVTGTPVVALDAAGLTGAPSTATTLTDDDAASQERCFRTPVIPDDSNPLVYRFFVSKDSDTSRFPAFLVQLISGSTPAHIYTTLNTQTGELTVYDFAGTYSSEVNSSGDWWEVLLSVTNNSTGHVGGRVYIYPAFGTVAGVGSNAATGSIIVGNVELHLNKTIAQVRGSSPIVTAASTVTTTAISMSYDIANHSDEKGAYYCEFTPMFTSAETVGTRAGIVSLNGTDYSLMYVHNTAGKFASFDGSNVLDVSVSFVAAQSEKLGVSYGGASRSVQAAGYATTDGAYDGSFSPGASILTANAGIGVRLIRNIRRYDLPYDEAKAKIDELMT